MVALPGTLTTNAGDRFHEQIVDILIFCSALIKAAHNTGMSHVPPGSLAKVECEHLPYEILFDAHMPSDLALAGNLPPAVSLLVRQKVQENHPNTTTATASVTVRVFSALFAIACEGPLEWQRTVTKDLNQWPPVLAFSRVVRNAIAHDGRIQMNASAPGVTWRGLTYDHTDNGRALIGPQIGTGDLLILMFDLQEELSVLSAP